MYASGAREAEILYKSGDYDIISHGDFVLCAVTGEKIPLDELKYWNHLRQEAYRDCEASYQRELECNPHLRKLMGSSL